MTQVVPFDSGEEAYQRNRSRRGRGAPGDSKLGYIPLPADPEVEDAVISLCVLDGAEMLTRCAKQGITPSAFSVPSRRIMFEALQRLVALGAQIDAALLVVELRESGTLEAVGGATAVVEATSLLATTAQANVYLSKLRTVALRRAMVEAASCVLREAMEFSGDEIDSFCARQEDRMLNVTRARVGAVRAAGGALPRLMGWNDLVGEKPRPEPPQLVAGVIHRGGKVMLGGGSKSFKTWCLMDLGLSVATGSPWWGFQTVKGRVLYVNFELQTWSFESRTRAICAAKNIPSTGDRTASDFVSWHLRGYAEDLRNLIPQFLVQTVGSKFDLIILDPIYKCLGERDENANGEVAGLLNEVEALAVRSDAAVVFGHHFSKGNQSAKDARDRVSGAGAWTRDPDSVITLTPHEEEDCFSAEFVLRDLKPRSPVVVRWSHPCMLADQNLDPSKLRQAGAPPKWSVETLVDLLKKAEAFSMNSGLTYTKLEALAKAKHEMTASSFKRYIKQATESGRIEHSGPLYFVDE